MRSPALRLAVTLLLPVLLVVAGERVLLPGMEDLVGGILQRGDFLSLGRSHLSVFALGIGPVVTAYGLVELTAFLVPRWSRLRHGNPEGRAKLERAARALAIVLAALQGWSTARALAALSEGSDIFAMPALETPTWMLVATLVGGVCVQIVVAQLISKQGIVNGFVMLSVVEALAELRGTFLAPLRKALYLGSLEAKDVAILVLVFALPALATWLALRGGAATPPPGVESGAKTSAAATTSTSASAAATTSAGPYRAARALAARPWVPIPSSSLAPYLVAGSLAGVPLTLATMLHLGKSATRSAESLLQLVPYTLTVALLTLGLAVVLARLVQRPREMARVARGVGVAGGEEIAEEAHAAVRASLLPTLLFFAVLVAASAASFALPVHPSVVFVPLLVATVMDAVASLRDAKGVAIWQERRASAVPVVRAVLAAEGIASTVRGLSVLSLLQVFAPYAPAEILVDAADAERATALLRHVFLGKKRPEPEPHDALTTDDVAVGWSPARRLRALGVAAVAALATMVAANVRLPTPEAMKAPRGRLEIVRVDDEDDIFGRVPEAELPRGIEIFRENAPAGRGHTATVHFARAAMLAEEGGSYAAAAARLRRWCDTLTLPEGARIVFEPVDEVDEESLTSRRTGLRTFVITGKAIITEGDVVEAAASVTTTNGEAQAYVAVTLSEEAAERFRVATAENVQRRIAIVVNGQVESAPVVKSEIGGGRISITMGAGRGDVQLALAKALAKSLAETR